MDRIGIDYSFVNPGGAYAGSVASSNQFFDDPRLRHRAMVLCNDYLADNFEPYTGRVSPVTILDFDDLDWSIGEMERMRAGEAARTSCGPRRSKAVHPRIPRPTGSGVRPPTSGWWRCCTSATRPAHFAGGWADAGWDEPDGAGMSGLLRFANSQRTEAAQTFLAALLFGGTFTRNPGVTIVLAELWASWLPWFVSRLEMLGDANGALGEWPHELSPGALARQHVKASPLPGLHDDGMEAIHEVPDMLVFSSDFPHNEGNVDPITLYGDALGQLDAATRDAFMGGTITLVYEQMGDPLPV